MNLALIIPIIIVALFIVTLCVGLSLTGRNRTMNRMMKKQMDMMKDMTEGELRERFKEMSKAAINLRKNVLEDNQEALGDMANMEAEIQKDAIKIKAGAVKEAFSGTNKNYCKHCGEMIDLDSKFCKKCGGRQ